MAARNTLALDVGEQRVGVALARAGLNIPVALPTLERTNANFWDTLLDLLTTHDVATVVIGLPRGMEGQATAQTAAVEAFGKELQSKKQVTIVWQDEAVTSVEAERQLQASGQPYTKADIDARAACLILGDYLEGARNT
jgi:putative Holliday junction resolvase